MSDDVKLKACPFCGGTNIDPDGWASIGSSGPACDDCGGSAGSGLNTRAENIAAWNNRAPDGEGGA
jgi:Lar family restriction alleviation protein